MVHRRFRHHHRGALSAATRLARRRAASGVATLVAASGNFFNIPRGFALFTFVFVLFEDTNFNHFAAFGFAAIVPGEFDGGDANIFTFHHKAGVLHLHLFGFRTAHFANARGIAAVFIVFAAIQLWIAAFHRGRTTGQ